MMSLVPHRSQACHTCTADDNLCPPPSPVTMPFDMLLYLV